MWSVVYVGISGLVVEEKMYYQLEILRTTPHSANRAISDSRLDGSPDSIYDQSGRMINSSNSFKLKPRFIIL